MTAAARGAAAASVDAAMTLAAPVLASPHWYRVAQLQPRLAARARLHRHRYRGQTWYLLHDPASGQVLRFTPSARWLIAAMDGQRSVEQLWQQARQALGENAPSPDELLALLGQLHAADLLAGALQPDVRELLSRGQAQRRRQQQQAWRNPLALKLRLWDPGPWLDRHARWWPRLWSAPAAWLWLALVGSALLALPSAWSTLGGNLADRVLQPGNLLLLALVFPLQKLLHELGHATATHARGGEVHDMGLMLLVGMPVPYVDASAATVLPRRRDRLLVSAAGMVVDLALAAIAFWLWCALEPGVPRALCFNLMLTAGVSTLLFNGNPLLRYDAYYMLADALEMPNLALRAGRAWRGLVERLLLRLPDAEAAPARGREHAWLLAYGALSPAYRVLVTLLLALFIGSRFFVIGAALALWLVAAMVLKPLWQGWRALQRRPSLRARRGRVLAIMLTGLAMLLTLAVVVPLPDRSQAEGVVWLDPQAVLRAGDSGVVAELLVAPGQLVQAGTPLLRSHDQALRAELQRQRARVAEVQAAYDAQWVADPAQAELQRQQLQFETAALQQLQQRQDSLTLRAARDGRFMPLRGADTLGRFHRQGDVLGHLVDDGAGRRVRVLVDQAAADAVAQRLQGVSLRLAANPAAVLPARLLRSVPAASGQAPHRALASSGGGAMATDPRDPQGLKLLHSAFELELAPAEGWGGPAPAYGQRVHVRFELAPAPLAQQLRGTLRRLFLSHFGQ